MTFIGQRKLQEKLNKYTRETLPKTLLFLGDEGCGKHTLIKMLAEKCTLDVIEISEKFDAEQLIDFTQKTVPTAYIINLTGFTEKQQNQFLKFIEEPSESVFVMLMANSEIGILPTILNRCVKLRFEQYSREELQAIANTNITNDLVFEVCKTPGMLTGLDTKTFNDLYELCVKLVTKIRVASYANTMSIFTKINCKDEYSKFDFNLFFNTLEYVAFTDFKNTLNEDSFKVYQITNRFKQARINKTIAKESFILNFLTQLWKEFHE